MLGALRMALQTVPCISAKDCLERILAYSLMTCLQVGQSKHISRGCYLIDLVDWWGLF